MVFLGFGLYKFYFSTNRNQEKINTDNKEQALPPQQINADDSVKPNIKTNLPSGVKAQGSGQGTLMICSDRCGDGVCQAVADPKCPSGDFECVCLETKSDCPVDCK